MKKQILVLSALALVSYACNRDQKTQTTKDTTIQREETRSVPMDAPQEMNVPEEEQKMDAPADSTPGAHVDEGSEIQREEETFKQETESQGTNVPTSIDERPDLEEEEEAR